jgi:hypothetical protein
VTATLIAPKIDSGALSVKYQSCASSSVLYLVIIHHLGGFNCADLSRGIQRSTASRAPKLSLQFTKCKVPLILGPKCKVPLILGPKCKVPLILGPKCKVPLILVIRDDSFLESRMFESNHMYPLCYIFLGYVQNVIIESMTLRSFE